ncbi:MAG: ATP-binding cassette domain-containing protein [Pseudomonadota bacterium]
MTRDQDQALPERAGVACRLQGVDVRRGERAVLQGIDLEIRASERVALIGPNGAGKSSLMSAIVGLCPAERGVIETLGRPLSSRRTHSSVRAATGFVFQKHALVRRRSVLSNVLHGLMARRGAWRAWSATLAPAAWRTEAMAALAEVELSERAADRADRLSGGQAQRVAIARALVGGPELVIADEPTASLDPAAGREIMDLFGQLVVRHRATLLYATHDMEHGRAHADRIIGLKAGRIVLDAPSAAVTPPQLAELFDA